jgi:glc operon protein GlcG
MSSLRSLAFVLALVTAAALPARAAAQLLDTKTVSLAAARRMMTAAEAEARKNGWNVSIAIVDASGELLAFHRMDDSSPASVGVSQAKARTAARFRRPTKALEEAVAGGRTALLSFEGMAMVEGGVPITADGKVIGAVGVSGASSAQDAQVAQAAVATLAP